VCAQHFVPPMVECPACHGAFHYGCVDFARSHATRTIRADVLAFRCPACAAVMATRLRGAHVHCPEAGCARVVGSPEDLARHTAIEHAPFAVP
jgi:hypothetical protein